MLSKEANAALTEAIRRLHGCESRYVESVPVHEDFEGQAVWEGIVHVFDLKGHPIATRVYAWSYKIEGTGKERFVAVLHQGPVDSPLAAVRAAIIQETREAKS